MLDVGMKPQILGTCAVIAVVVLLLSILFQRYTLTVGFPELALVFSIGGTTGVVVQACWQKRKPVER
jgi:hypothetical protein